MKNRVKRFMGSLLSVVLLLTLLPATALGAVRPTQTIKTGTSPDVAGNQFISAVKTKNMDLRIEPGVTVSIQGDSEDSGRMKPIHFAENVTVTGDTGASLNFRSPMQLDGDDVVIQDITLSLYSSGSLGAVGHREIFLNGHSLTLDNVTTLTDTKGGSIEGLQYEKELLPIVYAGCYTGMNSKTGNHAQLTVTNAIQNHTVFQDIFMAHETHPGTADAYTGKATLRIGPKVQVRDGITMDGKTPSGIYTTGSSDASVYLIGTPGKNNPDSADLFQLHTDANTKLYAENISYRPAEDTVSHVGLLKLSGNSIVTAVPGMKINQLELGEGSKLELPSESPVFVQGAFTGGGTIQVSDGSSMGITGSISGQTAVTVLASSFLGRTYFYTKEDPGQDAFYIPDVQGETGPEPSPYQMTKKAGSDGWEWSITERVESRRIASVSVKVDNQELKGLTIDPESDLIRYIDRAPVYHKEFQMTVLDNKGVQMSAKELTERDIYLNVLAVKTSYWKDKDNLDSPNMSKRDWRGDFKLVNMSENSYQLQLPMTDVTEDYTLLFLSFGYDWFDDQSTFADVCDGQVLELIVKEIPLHFTGGEQAVSGEMEVAPVKDQFFTGSAIRPELDVKVNGTALQEGRDYEVNYTENVEPGLATGVLTGKNEYADKTGEVTFSIVKLSLKLLTENPVYGAKTEFEIRAEGKPEESRYISLMCNGKTIAQDYYGNGLTATLERWDSSQVIPAGVTSEISLMYGESSDSLRDTGVTIQMTLGKAGIGQKNFVAGYNSSIYAVMQQTSIGYSDTEQLVPITKLRMPSSSVELTVNGTVILPGKPALGLISGGTLKELSLTGDSASWYQLTEDVEGISVTFDYSTPVSIVKGTYTPEAVELPLLIDSGKDSLTLSEYLPEGARDSAVYQLQEEPGQFVTVSLSDGILSYTPKGEGQENIIVTVSSDNYQDIDLIFQFDVKDKLELEQAPLVINGLPTSAIFLGDSFDLTASGGSGNGEFNWSVSGPASLSQQNGAAAKLTITGVGQVTLTLKRAGDGKYLGKSLEQTFMAEAVLTTPEAVELVGQKAVRFPLGEGVTAQSCIAAVYDQRGQLLTLGMTELSKAKHGQLMIDLELSGGSMLKLFALNADSSPSCGTVTVQLPTEP